MKLMLGAGEEASAVIGKGKNDSSFDIGVMRN